MKDQMRYVFFFITLIVTSITFYCFISQILHVRDSQVDGIYSELVDYSENGEIGSKSFDINTVHTHKIKHRGVWVYILDSTKQNLLVLKRSIHHVTCPDTWTVCGEHCAPHEEYTASALRGMQEEIGISKNDIKEIGVISNIELFHLHYPKAQRRDIQWTKTFYVILQPTAKVKTSIEEVGYQWIPLNTSIEWFSYCKSSLNDLSSIANVDMANSKTISCRTCTDAADVQITSRISDGDNMNILQTVNYTSYFELTSSKIRLLISLINNKST